jgi:hypothetical protein
MDVVERINKVIASMILTLSVAVAEIKEISISFNVQDKTSLTIKVLSRFIKYFVDKLDNRNKIDLDTKNINTYLTLLLLEHYNAEIDYICEDNFLELKIVI